VRRLRQRIILPVLAAALIAFVVYAFGGPGSLPYAFGAALLGGALVAISVAGDLRRRLERMVADAGAVAVGSDTHTSAVSEDELGDFHRRVVDAVRTVASREHGMRERAGRLEAVLRHMADGVVVLESDGRISFANAAATVLLGISTLGELLGTRLLFVCRNPDLAELLDTMRESGRAETREITLEGPNRKVLFVSGAPVGGAGSMASVVLVLHDVTRVRRLESMRADFVANVSHELRTPLTAIRGYAETLLGGALDDSARARQFVHVIERHSERLSRLIDDLLTLSDLELGRTELRREPLDLREVVVGVLEVLGPKAGKKAIALQAEIPDDLPALVLDRDRIEQVLINLVDNAIKYTPADGSVRVSARSLGNGNGSGVEIDVTDSGIGIPEKDLSRLTERFYRVDRARSRELGGTGLGLAIVKHIVQAHGGSLTIESRVQKGTTVRVELPAAVPLAPA
jgi:two-component system, OmpR family, phosphate regulon sensor histidine kinase PhoR